MHRCIVAGASAFAVLAAGCAAGDGGNASADSQQAHIAAVVAAGGVVDSILPVEEHLKRFRNSIPEPPDTLRSASLSLEGLAERWRNAIAQRDTAALNAMVINRAEFAWLYYPTSHLSRAPYEAPPELLWGQILASSNDGAVKMLKRFGGKTLRISELQCDSTVTVEGSNRLHDDCRADLVADGDTVRDIRLFGTVMERNGRFKLIGLSNSL